MTPRRHLPVVQALSLSAALSSLSGCVVDPTTLAALNGLRVEAPSPQAPPSPAPSAAPQPNAPFPGPDKAAAEPGLPPKEAPGKLPAPADAAEVLNVEPVEAIPFGDMPIDKVTVDRGFFPALPKGSVKLSPTDRPQPKWASLKLGLPEEFPLPPADLTKVEPPTRVVDLLEVPLVQDLSKLPPEVFAKTGGKPVPPQLVNERAAAGTWLTVRGAFGSADELGYAVEGPLGSVPCTEVQPSAEADNEVLVRVPESARPGANRLQLRYADGVTYDLPFTVTSVSVPLVFLSASVNEQMRTLGVRIHNHNPSRSSNRPHYEARNQSFLRFGGNTSPLAIPPVVRDLGGAGVMEGYIRRLESSGASARLEGNTFRLELTFAEHGEAEIACYNTGSAVLAGLEDDFMPDINLRNVRLTIDMPLVVRNGNLSYDVGPITMQGEITDTSILPSALIRAIFDYDAEIRRQVPANLRTVLNGAQARNQLEGSLNVQFRRALGLAPTTRFTGLEVGTSRALLTWE